MKIRAFVVSAVIGLAATSVSAQHFSPYGAPLGSGGDAITFCGGHLPMRIPTENLHSYSMSFWLSPNDFTSESFFLGQESQGIHLGFRQGPEGGNYNRLHQAHWGSDHSGETIVPKGDPSDPDSWVHALFTFDSEAGVGQVFYNGASDDGGGVAKDWPNQFGPENTLILGGRNGGSHGFIGQMDDAAFWDHVISEDHIAAIASGTLPTDIADPAQLFYDFDAGTQEFTSTAAGNGIWDVPADHPIRNPLSAATPPPDPWLEDKQPLVDGNWNVRMIKISGADSEINDLAEAHAIVDFADGGPNTNGWTIDVDVRDSRERIDMSRTEWIGCYQHWGQFPHDHPFPDGSGGDSQIDLDEQFLVHSSTEAPLVFPEGTYSIGFRATAGGGNLRILPTDGSEFSFTLEDNVSGDVGLDDTLTNDGALRPPRPWTCGEFTVGPAGMQAHVDSMWVRHPESRAAGWLRPDSANYEIAIGNGPCENPHFDYQENGPTALMLSGSGEASADGTTDGIRVAGVPRSMFCDMNGDGECNLNDLDLLYKKYSTTTDSVSTWLSQASSAPGATQLVFGDINLNGKVNSTDLGLLLNNFGRGSSGWSTGDLNDDLRIDSTDLGLLLNNFGFQSPNVAVVPEPSAGLLVWFVAMALWSVSRRRRFNRAARLL